MVARAALEGITWRVADVVAAIRETSPVESLRVDGGLTNEPLVLQLQADAIGAPVEAAGADATVLGAAALAAVGSGLIGSLEEAAELLPVDRRVEPQRDDAWRDEQHERWQAFVAATEPLDRASAQRVPTKGCLTPLGVAKARRRSPQRRAIVVPSFMRAASRRRRRRRRRRTTRCPRASPR